jgi:hypothetical protein
MAGGLTDSEMADSIRFTEQGFVYSGDGFVVFLVPITEIAAPIPDCPAKMLLFCHASEGGIKIHA